MKHRIDLHLHTTCSDGLTPPDQLLELVRRAGLAAFSVTDHDTLAGYQRVRSLLQEGDPVLIPGLELSCSSERGDLHILAYLFDPDTEPLRQALDGFQENRMRRGRVMVEKLNELGVEITYDEVLEVAGDAAVGRPHVAEAMFRRQAVPTYDDAFRRYIGDRGPAYVPKKNFAPPEAIALIHQAGGMAVLAHPMIDRAADRIEELAALGLDGLETHHPDHSAGDKDRLKEIAKQHRMLWTGGSDFHGRPGRCGTVGSEAVPIECLEELKRRAAQMWALQNRGSV